MIFGGWQKFSMIDYPGKTSAILFTQGCPFRCPFCHNPELINIEQGMFAPVTENEIFDFLSTRQGKLDAIVISGGEPTLQYDLLDFIGRIKQMGFLVKLDTNGSRPEVVIDAVNRRLVNYFAMDIKSPIEKYKTHTNSAIAEEKIRESISLIMNSGVDYEFRTTVVKEQLSPDDILQIGRLIKGARLYILQKFIPDKTLDPLFAELTTYTDEEFNWLCNSLKSFVAQCSWR